MFANWHIVKLTVLSADIQEKFILLTPCNICIQTGKAVANYVFCYMFDIEPKSMVQL